ncbi:hypothetical protein [Kitasatospora sp. NPDC098663]|uniref:hypothetical protein n=1 Tax=Kitasatospora sp. NPDC098663 TaxID=3364096 RepID=UPI003813D9C9
MAGRRRVRAAVEICTRAVLRRADDGSVGLSHFLLPESTETEFGQCGNQPTDPTGDTDQIRRIAPVKVGGPKVLPKIEALTRTDVITYVDRDGNPQTEYSINGQGIVAPITRNIHDHVIDPGRSGSSYAWACAIHDSASNSGIPDAVRARFADAIQTSGHDCHEEQCTSCVNCLMEPCPLITDIARERTDAHAAEETEEAEEAEERACPRSTPALFPSRRSCHAATTATPALPSPSGSSSDEEALMAIETTRTDTFAALDSCFTSELAILIGTEPPRGLTLNRFIYLVEEVRDALAGSSHINFQDASNHLDSAAAYLTDALTEPATAQAALLAQARIHLRGAIETAS